MKNFLKFGEVIQGMLTLFILFVIGLPVTGSAEPAACRAGSDANALNLTSALAGGCAGRSVVRRSHSP